MLAEGISVRMVQEIGVAREGLNRRQEPLEDIKILLLVLDQFQP